MRYMVSRRLLQSYREIGGIHDALRGIETRLRRPSRLGESVRELELNYPALRSDFERFFPLLVEFGQAQTSWRG
jgi:acyl carrier protein phosphodiesterase